MRTFLFLVLAALLAGVVVAFAVGFVDVGTDHPQGKYIVTFTVHTDMVCPLSSQAHANTGNDVIDDLKGKVVAVRPEKNEIVVVDNMKNWTILLAKEGKVVVNGNDSKLSDVQPGDEAVVSLMRQGPQMIANIIRCTRK